jgi:hypothetical protein
MMRIRVLVDDESCRSCRKSITTNTKNPASGWYDTGFLYCDYCGTNIQKHDRFYRKVRK